MKSSGQCSSGCGTKVREPAGKHGLKSIFLRGRFAFDGRKLIFKFRRRINHAEGLGFFSGNPKESLRAAGGGCGPR